MQTIARYLGTEPTKEWQLVLVMGALELVFSQVRPLSAGAAGCTCRRLHACCTAGQRHGHKRQLGCVTPSSPPAPPRSLPLQFPSLEEIWWVSALGTASSLGYVLIALVRC